jgi:HrpA-like RNA helicase
LHHPSRLVEIPYALECIVAQAVEVHRANACSKGDILVFLCSQDEIDRAITMTDKALNGDKTVLLLPLHGKLQQKDRNRVFMPAESGTRKVSVRTGPPLGWRLVLVKWSELMTTTGYCLRYRLYFRRT